MRTTKKTSCSSTRFRVRTCCGRRAQPDASQLRLVGLLHDRMRGLALLDTPDGATTVVSGQRLGAERVTRLDALSITLVNGGGTRTLALSEAS